MGAPHLSEAQQSELADVLAEYPDIVTTELGLAKNEIAEILVKDGYPIRSPPYRIAPGMGGDRRFGRKGHNSPLKESLDLSHGTCKEEGNRMNMPLYRLQTSQ